MRIPNLFVCVTVVVALTVSLAGCQSSEMDGTPPPLVSEADGDGHEGHDHGGEASGGYPTEGPHGGHLIELGDEEYHAELLHDENTHCVTIHLLDGAGKEAVAAPLQEITLQLARDGEFVQYVLKAVPSQDGIAGAASQFAIVDDVLCDALGHEDELLGRLQVTLDGQPYTGTIQHSSHDAHQGHDHAEEGHTAH